MLLRRTLAAPAVALALALSTLGCPAGSDAPTEPTTGTSPWLVPMTMGNFSVNTKELTTNSDGQSSARIVDWVPMANLPATNLEVFTIHAYVPTADGYTVNLNNVRVALAREDASSTGNVFRSDMSGYVQRSTLGGQVYSVFRITGFHVGSAGSPSFTPQTFANVTYSFDVEYVSSSTGATQSTRPMTLEVYKRR